MTSRTDTSHGIKIGQHSVWVLVGTVTPRMWYLYIIRIVRSRILGYEYYVSSSLLWSAETSSGWRKMVNTTTCRLAERGSGWSIHSTSCLPLTLWTKID